MAEQDTVRLEHTGAEIDQTIEGLEDLMTKLGDINEDDYNKLQTAVTDLKTQSSNYEINIKSQGEDITKLQRTVSTMDGTVSSQSSRLNVIETNQNSYYTSLSQKVNVKDYNTKVESLENKDEDLEDKIKAEEERAFANESALNTEVFNNKTNIAINSKSITDLVSIFGSTQAIEDLVKKIDKIDVDAISTLQNQAQDFSNRITTLENNSVTREELNDYITRDEGNTNYVNQSQLSEYIQRIVDLEAAIEELREQINNGQNE